MLLKKYNPTKFGVEFWAWVFRWVYLPPKKSTGLFWCLPEYLNPNRRWHPRLDLYTDKWHPPNSKSWRPHCVNSYRIDPCHFQRYQCAGRTALAKNPLFVALFAECRRQVWQCGRWNPWKTSRRMWSWNGRILRWRIDFSAPRLQTSLSPRVATTFSAANQGSETIITT